MTQEIGFVTCPDPIEFDKFPIGTTLELLQYHSCDTAMRFDTYFLHDENDIVVEEWKPARCW